ncbi:MAG: SprT family zinc-dependent metalloprotease [Candidatus Omnitrophica bacterium]|nr:SprT family zinc-dependent metalloprotease [Candidatus Omnitrophota bacterium]
MKIKNCQIVTAAGTLSYVYVRSPRRKTVAIQIDQDLEVRVFAPSFLNEQEVIDFIEDKAFWIKQKINAFKKRHFCSTKRLFSDGEEFLFLGEKHKLCYQETLNKKVSIQFSSDHWDVYVPKVLAQEDIEPLVRKAFVQWYQREAREILASRIFYFARILKVDPSKVSIRTQKKIWGSCHHSTKRINLNWKIVMAPLRVMDYIIVHELCHLKTPNHSSKFWDRVQKVLPKYKECEKWLYGHSGLMVLS